MLVLSLFSNICLSNKRRAATAVHLWLLWFRPNILIFQLERKKKSLGLKLKTSYSESYFKIIFVSKSVLSMIDPASINFVLVLSM